MQGQDLSMTRGRWIQVIAIVVPVMVAVFAGAWSLSGQIAGVSRDIAMLSERVKSDEASIKDQNLSLTQMVTRLPLAEQRIDNLSKVESDHYAEETSYRQTMGSKLEVILDRLADLRVQMGVKPTPERK